jgi:hypothetical protein
LTKERKKVKKHLTLSIFFDEFSVYKSIVQKKFLKKNTGLVLFVLVREILG